MRRGAEPRVSVSVLDVQVEVEVSPTEVCLWVYRGQRRVRYVAMFSTDEGTGVVEPDRPVRRAKAAKAR